MYVDSLAVAGREDPDEHLQNPMKELCTAQHIQVPNDLSLKLSGNLGPFARAVADDAGVYA